MREEIGLRDASATKMKEFAAVMDFTVAEILTVVVED